MKKSYTLFLILGLFFSQFTSAQNTPIAVNDTFYVDYSDLALNRTFNRTSIISNDIDIDGNIKIIDSISYYGVNQVQVVYFPGTNYWLGVRDIILTTNPGYFGLDSITYYLTDNGFPTGFDTALIYIYVKRKDYEIMDINNISARVKMNELFGNRTYGHGFEVPKGSGSSTIYSSNFLFLGKDVNGSLKGYAETYGEAFGNPGPIMDTVFYKEYSYKWHRVWKISASDIQNHNSGTFTTEAITNWPAHGDTTRGEAYYLAPFVDVNFDGIYSPTLGDYPKIKGQQAIYFIRNSDRFVSNSYTPNSMLEFHGMVYAFDCPEDSAINHSVFVDYKVINRSTFDLFDCYFGQWVDLDIGNIIDDYVACDVSRGTFYAYNADSFDEDVNGILGYQNHIPAQGITFLKGAKQANDGIDNPITSDIPLVITQNGIPYEGLGIGYGDGIIDNEYLGLSHFINYNFGNIINGNGEPRNGVDYYDYMRGHWLDSVGSIEWGGDGNPLGTSGGVPSNYIFSGNSDPLFWSTNGLSVIPMHWFDGGFSGDKRGIGSTGPFTLLAGESAEFEVAFVFGRDYVNAGNLPGIVVMQERIDSIRSYHANGFATTACGGAIIGIKDNIIKNDVLTIYPNPFTNQFFVKYKSNQNGLVEIFSILGKKILSQPLINETTTFDLSNESNGIYFVRVTNGSELLTEKIIKQ